MGNLLNMCDVRGGKKLPIDRSCNLGGYHDHDSTLNFQP